MIITVNVRELLHEYRDDPIIQRYLDQWRLAAKDDEPQLLQYYESQQIDRHEGLTPREFLERAATIKGACDAFENDPFQDVDLIGIGYNTADPRLTAIVVEGTFRQQNPARLELFFQQHLFPLNQADGPSLALLDNQALVYADSQTTMNAIQACARQDSGVLPAGVRALVDSGRKQHLSVVVNHLEANAQRLAKFVEQELADSLGLDHPISQFVTGPVVDWIKQNSAEFAAVSFAVSVRRDELHLELGLGAKDVNRALELRTLIDGSSFLGAQILKVVDHDLAPPLAGILSRLRTTLNGTTVIVRVDVPRQFLSQVRHDLSRDIFPDSTNASAKSKALPGQGDVQNLVGQATSISLWKSGVDSAQIELVRDIPYLTGPNADPFRHRLDMVLPKNKRGFPVVVLLHGGGWDEGDNRCSGLYSSVGEFLASQGIGVVLPNYGLSPGVTHPEHVRDAARAVAWTRSHAEEYGGDASQLFLLGHSAGGHLVSLLAADESYLHAEGMKAANIKGVITFSGVYRIPEGPMYGALGGSGPRALRISQMLPLRGESGPVWNWSPPGLPVTVNIFGAAFGNSSEVRAQASPIMHVHRDMPRFLIVSPEHDLPTLIPMAKEFHAALRESGCDARLLSIPRRNHNSLLFSAITPQDPAAQAILEFMGQ